MQCVAWRFVADLDGMTIYLNNTYGFIRLGIRVMRHAWYDKSLPGVIMLDSYDSIRSEYLHERGLCSGSGKFCCYHFRTGGLDTRVRPAGRRHDKGPPAGSCKFYKKMKNVSCEYDRLNGLNSTLQAAWYIYISCMIPVWCLSLKMANPQATSAGSTRGSAKNSPRVMMA